VDVLIARIDILLEQCRSCAVETSQAVDPVLFKIYIVCFNGAQEKNKNYSALFLKSGYNGIPGSFPAFPGHSRHSRVIPGIPGSDQDNPPIFQIKDQKQGLFSGLA
jgi:hypothetical protein